MLRHCYATATRSKLGKITYPKIAQILCVFLYSVALLFSLFYKK